MRLLWHTQIPGDDVEVNVLICNDMELAAVSDALQTSIRLGEERLDPTDILEWDILNRFKEMYQVFLDDEGYQGPFSLPD